MSMVCKILSDNYILIMNGNNFILQQIYDRLTSIGISDISWNPSKDMQAIDRAHRLGQKKIVQVFRLITTNSIEEQLISLQTFKKYISNNVVDTSKIHEDKVNLNSVMQSFEEFSKDRMNLMRENVKKKKLSKYEELANINEEDEIREEMEIAYLQKLVEK